MKNLLFISDTFLGGGLETRIIEQIAILKKHKVKPFLLCREFSPIYSKNFFILSNALTLKPSSDGILAKTVLKDADTIYHFCLENNIDYIDCHPFWCALPAALAADRLKIPISFTLHGEISANFIAKEYLTAQALYDATFSYGFDQIFAVAEYLTELYSYLPNIKIIRNGLPINRLESQTFKNTKKIAIASRLDEPKTKLIIDFLPTVYSSKSIDQIDIYGDGDHFKNLQDYINEHNMSNKVHLCGWAKNFAKIIAQNDYMLAIGMGRVVLETIKSGIPVGILGYGGFAGLVNRDNILIHSKNNLTSWKKSPNSFSTELKQLFKNPNNYFFKSNQLSIFNIELIWQEYYNITQKLTHHNNHFADALHDWLSQHASIDILSNQDLFLTSIRLLSDGHHAISPRLFYNVFQQQFDQIHTLTADLNLLDSALKKEQSLSFSEFAKKRIHSRINKKNKNV